MGKHQQFTKEFKLEAVRMWKSSGRAAAAVARELGLRRNHLYKWATEMEHHGAVAFPGSGRQRDEEVACLKRELARVTEERDILKKAARYFARESA
jgi:transposase